MSQPETRAESSSRAAIPSPRTSPEERAPQSSSSPPGPAAAAPGFGWAAAGLAMGIYLGLRMIGVALVWHFATDRHIDMQEQLGRWDAGWYAEIARHGYDLVVPIARNGGPGPSDLAFFPLFPGLIALVNPILPGSATIAGIALAWLFGIVAAAGLYALGSLLRDRATGVLLAAAWAVIPHGWVESMGYAETLFTALAAWSLYFVLRRQWLPAGLLCLLAGLTRPTSAALIAVVGISALVAVVRRPADWRAWTAGLLAPLGLLGYVAWVGDRLGRWDGYFYVQNKAWGLNYDHGGFTLHTVHRLLTYAGPLSLYVVAVVLVAALALLIILVVDRWPWQLWLYSAAVFAMAFFSADYFHAKGRQLVPAFALLLPVAYALAKARRGVAVTVIGALTLASAGYGVYLSLVWTGSP